MRIPLKGKMKRRFQEVCDRVLDDYGLPENDAIIPTEQKHSRATVIWWTKSTGQIVRNGVVLKEFKTQKDLVDWMERVHKELVR
jgi:glycerol kinase